ncbi:hypothetical protein CAOG_01923 [Capsaspora owczarzaki ATCC 30864]|uniref:Uncharacterized protein n=1 Tax=Capsaspora owczarzaki (strain ATCC 30864) TaxID=595528 RepID=A0A0D2U690_CAPO3|nr:hypothetical protein CAOG_01923 [Capsaspora owczarzaki ATCC 30864]KJE90646.1 hypothetical protein CAOG_001923 [Capsaspora owczarzaki ATCC 30864]|eukprot:XP_004364791.1 hypothetical protein CAOG_01923 [Capsaspora owczarzaki ATCC 30864]
MPPTPPHAANVAATSSAVQLRIRCCPVIPEPLEEAAACLVTAQLLHDPRLAGLSITTTAQTFDMATLEEIKALFEEQKTNLTQQIESLRTDVSKKLDDVDAKTSFMVEARMRASLAKRFGEDYACQQFVEPRCGTITARWE